MSSRFHLRLKLTAVALTMVFGLSGCWIPFLDPIIIGTWLLQSVDGQEVDPDSEMILTINRDKTFTQSMTFAGITIDADGTWEFDRTSRELTLTINDTSSTSIVAGGLQTMTLTNPDHPENEGSVYQRQGLS